MSNPDPELSRSAGGPGVGGIRSFDHEELERQLEAVRARFTYQPPKPEDRIRYETIGAAFRELAEIIVRDVPNGRERDTALTYLSDARMHANAGIALFGTKGA